MVVRNDLNLKSLLNILHLRSDDASLAELGGWVGYEGS